MSEIDGYELQQVAWDAFDRWCLDHDPDGNLDPLERVDAYSKWCAKQWKLQHNIS